MRRLLVLVALSLALIAPSAAKADNRQGVALAQTSQATAVASVLATGNGGTCFAGCPTIIVSQATAVAISFNVAVVTQMLNQIGLRH